MKPGEQRLLEITGKRNLTSKDFPNPPGRGPNGRKLCCWCHNEVAPRRSRFCSDSCRREYECLVVPQVRRPRIYRRDEWRCQLCDTPLIPWNKLRTRIAREVGYESFAIFNSLEWPRCDDGYEIDHITPIAEGGSNHPSNLRTLCLKCHKDETRKLQARLPRWSQEDYEMAHRDLWDAQDDLRKYMAAVDAYGAKHYEAMVIALRHVIDCEGGINDHCGKFFDSCDCPFCEHLRDRFGFRSAEE